MEELVQQVSQRAGISEEQARTAVETVAEILKDRIPAPYNKYIETFITGEGAHHTYFDAEELRLNVLYAGHYATETLGVRALGEHLSAKFGLPGTFLDHPTGL